MTPSLQARIDAMAYPPTHTYRLDPRDGLACPTGILSERWSLLARTFHGAHHHSQQRFLDVGASKGFFSLRAQRIGYDVEALDTDPAAVALCRDLGINATLASFREWPPPEHRFDLVFIGNAHHYAYQEAGWSWVRKLAAVTADNGTVIIEGPLDASECRDVLTMTPRMSAEQMLDFTWPAMLREMSPWFDLASKVPTVGYTPDRYITVWRRRARAALSADVTTGRGPLTLGAEEFFVKLRDHAPHLRRSVEFAITAWDVPRQANLCDAVGRFCGWIEPRVTPDPRFAPGWRQREYSADLRDLERAAFRAACLRNAELARMGMVDVDMGPANWFYAPGEPRGTWMNAPGNWRTFDKNSIWPIATLDEGELGPTGRFLRTLEWASSPAAVPPVVRATLERALATRNSRSVEAAFLAVAGDLA